MNIEEADQIKLYNKINIFYELEFLLSGILSGIGWGALECWGADDLVLGF